MKYDSIGFDLDGTLWNPLEAITEAWIITADKHNLPRITKEDMAGALGLNKIDLMNKLYPGLDSEAQMKFFEDGIVACDEILSQKAECFLTDLRKRLLNLKNILSFISSATVRAASLKLFYVFTSLKITSATRSTLTQDAFLKVRI